MVSKGSPKVADVRPNPPFEARVWVAGAAKTKGSLTAQVAPGVTASGRRRVRMVESVRGSSAWRAATVQAVMAALGGAPSPEGPRLPCKPWERPVAVALCLWLPRPATTAPADSWPTSQRTGDVDKLQRNVGDALVDVGLLADDSLIVSWRATKLWAPSPLQAGALIVVTPAGPPVAPEWTRVDTRG